MPMQAANGTRMLIVDDDEVDRMAIRRTLKQTRIPVTLEEAVSCEAALSKIQDNSFDCAFIDYHLPDGNGIDLVRQLRSQGITYPLIALTGQGDEQIAVDLMKAGASDYIAKSKIRPDLLYRVVQQCLRLHRAEQEAAQVKQQREALLAQREEFISRMTHDMQTPLVGANRMLELIQDDAFGEIPDSAKAKMAVIVRSNNDLLKMVRDLVEVYSFEVGEKAMTLLPIDLRNLGQEVIQELQSLTIDRDLELTLKILDPQLNYQALVDRLEFKRVLINLVGNSLKFTESGSITIEMTGSSPSRSMLEIVIQDTGVGIAPEDQTQLFERFRRGKHKRSNSGLGLYLCRQIVERHQGKIYVESVLNQGSRFIIQLPSLHPELSV